MSAPATPYQQYLRMLPVKPRPEYGTAWELANPHLREVQYIVHLAKRLGWLVPQPCEVCGAVRVEGHHDDYDRPLAVRWLCRLHHRRHHAEAA